MSTAQKITALSAVNEFHSRIYIPLLPTPITPTPHNLFTAQLHVTPALCKSAGLYLNLPSIFQASPSSPPFLSHPLWPLFTRPP